MKSSPQTTLTAGLALTIAAFFAGHYLYQNGYERVGYSIGLAAFGPLAFASYRVWTDTKKTWAKLLCAVVLILWGTMLVFPLL